MKNNKSKLREKYKQIRANLSTDYLLKNQPIIDQKVIDVLKQNQPKNVLIYYPIIDSNEVDTKTIIQYCFEHDINVYLPRWENLKMDFYLIDSFDDLEQIDKSYMPKASLNKLKEEQIDLAFIPLIAVDKYLNRIGYGKGYYDRWINEHNKQINKLIGLAWKEQVTNEPIQKELTDKPLNRVIIN